MFDHKRFKSEITDLLEVFDSGALDRAWEVACGLMEVLAKVDRRDGDSLENSRRAAWLDFYRCWNDEKVTFSYWGVYEEMRHSVRGRAEELESHIIDIGKSCTQSKSRKKTPTKTRKSRQKEPRLRDTGHPHLRVVESK